MNQDALQISRHAELKSRLLETIAGSGLDTKLPSENALAGQFGVCRATVNKVMVELEREGYVRRLPGKGTFVSPRDKTVHGETPLAGNGTVVLAYPDFFGYSLWEEVHFAEQIAARRNYRLINFKMQYETNFKSLFELIGCCGDLVGLIIIPPSNGIPPQVLRRFDRLGVPCLSDQENVCLYPNIRTVTFDHVKSAYLRARALLEAGHRKIGFIADTPIYNPKTYQGLRIALAEYGLRRKDLIVSDLTVEQWSDNIENGRRLTLDLLDRHPEITALIVDTFPGAFGALRALYERKLRCPDDISIVTSMEMNNYTRMCCPALSCVGNDFEMMIGKMFDIIDNPESESSRSIILDVPFYARESICPPKQ